MRKKPYRQAINCIIVNDKNQFLVIQLQGYNSQQWKFVGGGIESNESSIQAAYREIKEETNISNNNLKLLGKSKYIQQYDFPEELKISKKYQGQKKIQYVFRFVGDNDSIIIQEAELKDYKWIPESELKNHLIFSGQLENAQKIIQEFNL